MILTIFKGFVLGLLLFIFGMFLWYLVDTSHISSLKVKDCKYAPGLGIKALDNIVQDSWFQRKHHDLQVFADGRCVFFQFYPKPGALYFGQEMASGYLIGVAMGSDELHHFANTIPANTDLQAMLDYLDARAKSNPPPKHDFD